MNKELKGYCKEEGIVMETSVPYTPEQNGVVERMNRTIKEKAWRLLVGMRCRRGNVGKCCGFHC
jgi:hypothetical protein